MTKTIILNIDELLKAKKEQMFKEKEEQEKNKEKYQELMKEVTDIFLCSLLNNEEYRVSVALGNKTNFFSLGKFEGTIFFYTIRGYLIGFGFNVIKGEIKYWQVNTNNAFPLVFNSGTELVKYVNSMKK